MTKNIMLTIPDLFYCASGNQRIAKLALLYLGGYGAQLPNKVYEVPMFVDQNWKKPNRIGYIQAIQALPQKPKYATVLDLEYAHQFDEVMGWAHEIAPYVKNVIIIPKCIGIIDTIPEQINKTPVVLGYSVPTRYGGTEVPLWEFKKRPVHLLGGSPPSQLLTRPYLNVVSVDGNYASLLAKYGSYFSAAPVPYALSKNYPQLQETQSGKIETDAMYIAITLTFINMRAAWNGVRVTIRFASLADIPAIKRLADSHRKELGFVNRTALAEAITKKNVMVAEFNGELVGFINAHTRKNGNKTIYELCVSPNHRGNGIGRALINSLGNVPIRLKCTVDNPANDFYTKVGFTCIGQEKPKIRVLNVYQRIGMM